MTRHLLLVGLVVCVTLAAAREVPLIEAVKNDDVAGVRALVKRPGAAKVTEPDGTTALHWAAQQGNEQIVDLLLKAGASAGAANTFGVVPLSLAVESGNAAIVDRLLRAGARATAALAAGETVLHTAARVGNPEVIKLLLAAGAKVDAAEDTRSQTPLMWAAASGNAAAARMLVEAGANVAARSIERDVKSVERRGSGANGYLDPKANNFSFSPLLFAVRNGKLDAMNVLLDAGANVNDTVSDGTSALTVACVNAHWELAARLLERGANPNAAGQGWAPLHQIARTRTFTIGHVPHPTGSGTMSPFDLVRMLVAKGANINALVTAKDIDDGYRHKVVWTGGTPLFIAAKGGDFEMVKLLLSLGADYRIKNATDTTPLMVAAGVDIWNPGEDTGTHEDHVKTVKALIDSGADVGGANSNGDTAMHGAARLGANGVVDLLVAAGATLNAKNATGITPYMVAVGRDLSGQTIFLSGQAQPQTAELLAKVMRARGEAPDEIPPPVYFRTNDKPMVNVPSTQPKQ
jgi:uncharacterized protein